MTSLPPNFCAFFYVFFFCLTMMAAGGSRVATGHRSRDSLNCSADNFCFFFSDSLCCRAFLTAVFVRQDTALERQEFLSIFFNGTIQRDFGLSFRHCISCYLIVQRGFVIKFWLVEAVVSSGWFLSRLLSALMSCGIIVDLW